MLTVDEIVARLNEIVGPRFVSTNPIDKINYQHTLAYGGVGMGISSPLKGGLLLDMLGMDKILEVNPTMQYVVAEGGASVYAIHHALRRHGLMLPNFGTYGPAVVIGAMVNKGGIGYGMTRYGWIAGMVMSLEVIL